MSGLPEKKTAETDFGTTDENPECEHPPASDGIQYAPEKRTGEKFSKKYGSITIFFENPLSFPIESHYPECGLLKQLSPLLLPRIVRTVRGSFLKNDKISLFPRIQQNVDSGCKAALSASFPASMSIIHKEKWTKKSFSVCFQCFPGYITG